MLTEHKPQNRTKIGNLKKGLVSIEPILLVRQNDAPYRLFFIITKTEIINST